MQNALTEAIADDRPGEFVSPEREVLDAPPRPAGLRAGLRLFAIRSLNYLTNHLVAHVPSFTLRHLWYARVMRIDLDPSAGVNLGAFLWTYGPRANQREGARIGANSRIGHDCTLDFRSGLSIGANVSISPEVMILGGTHDINGARFADIAGFVTIEDHAWIGARAIILPGVTIGRGAVVAAGAVVSKHVPELTVVAGVPAKPIAVRDPAAVAYELRSPLGLFE